MTKTRPLQMVPLKNDLIWPGGIFKPKNYLSLSHCILWCSRYPTVQYLVKSILKKSSRPQKFTTGYLQKFAKYIFELHFVK